MLKKRMFWFYVPLLMSALALQPQAQAADHPVQLSLVAPIQIFPEQDSISGIRLNFLYGKNAEVNGLDWGLVNHVTGGRSVGVALGGFTFNEGAYKGLQWGFFNYCASMQGLQVGFINYAETMNGVQIGLVNFIERGGIYPVLPIVNWSF